MKRRTISYLSAVRKANERGQISVGNIDGNTDWTDALAECGVVVHLAGRVHHMQEQLADPLAIYRTANRDATIALAQSAADRGVRRFVFLSTIKVNGESTQGKPFSSDDLPQPGDAYARSKWEAEEEVRRIGDRSGMEIVVVRPPLVYGPGVRANFLRLMHLVKQGVPLPLGCVDNRRSLISTTNLVDFLLLCITSPNAGGKTWLVSDQHDVSTAELVRLMATAMDKPPRLFPVTPGLLAGAAAIFGKSKALSRLMDSLQVDSSPASSLLGWKPVLTVEQGIAAAVQDFLEK